jgi:hypothetical protein
VGKVNQIQTNRIVAEVVEPIAVVHTPAGRYTRESYSIQKGTVRFGTLPKEYKLSLTHGREVRAMDFNEAAAQALGIEVDFSAAQTIVAAQIAVYEEAKLAAKRQRLTDVYNQFARYYAGLVEAKIALEPMITLEEYLKNTYETTTYLHHSQSYRGTKFSVNIMLRPASDSTKVFEVSVSGQGDYDRKRFSKLSSVVSWVHEVIAMERSRIDRSLVRAKQNVSTQSAIASLTGINPEPITEGYMSSERVVGYRLPLSSSTTVRFVAALDEGKLSISDLRVAGHVTPEQLTSVLNLLK